MDKEDLSRLAEKNSPLFLKLAGRSQDDLAKIALFSADCTGAETEKYRAFCAKLKFKNAPYLMVFEDDLAKKEAGFVNPRARGGQNSGYYDSVSNVVGITRSTFEAFKNNESSKERVVAHELGHAKHTTSRRRLFEDAAATVMAGAIAALAGGFVAKKTVDVAEAVYGEKIKDSAMLPFAAAACSASMAIPKIHAIMQREHEFTADRYASEILGKKNIIKTLVFEVEQRVITIHGEQEVHAIRTEFVDEISSLTDKEKRPSGEALVLAYAVFLANHARKKVPLKELWKHAPYPSYEDRIRRLAR